MKNTYSMVKQALMKTYIFDEDFGKQLVCDDTSAMASLWFMPFLDFDLGGLAGKKIDNVVLKLKVVGRNYPLEVELTSITQDWNPQYATYTESDNNKAWAVDGWASDVIMGEGHSLHYRRETSFDANSGILSVEVPKELVYAIINRESFGLGLVDAKSREYPEGAEENWKHSSFMLAKQFNINPEKGEIPVLEIEYSDAASVLPEGVFDLEVIAVQEQDSIEYASVVLSWSKNKNQADSCFYNIYVTEAGDSSPKAVERHMVPHLALEADLQGAEIFYLKPDTDYTFEVAISNGIEESKHESINIRTLPALEIPIIKKTTIREELKCEPAVSSSDYRVYLADDIIKVNPVSGCVLEAGAEGYKNATGVNIKEYSGAFSNGKLQLAGAPGEKMAFQLIFENLSGSKQEFSLDIKGKYDGISLSLYRVWYVNDNGSWYPEATIPLKEGSIFGNPFTDNSVNGQVYQAVLVDVELADTMNSGCFSFSIDIKHEGTTSTIEGALEVKPLSLEKPDFTFEANSYVAVPLFMGQDYYDKDYDRIEEEYYRTALEHDMTINVLPYDQMGQMQPRFAPKTGMVNGELRVTDWSEWDAHFAKYLDGTYTLEKFGKRIPITHMYLPFHENWPLPIDEYYKVKTESTSYPQLVNDVKLKSTTVEKDFLPGYREGIKSVVKDFITHFDENGWQHVLFQLYYNNKHYYKEKKVYGSWIANKTIGNEGKGTSWWLLDEPNHVDDFDALAYYGNILKEAQKELASGYNIKLRLDISGYNYMFDFLDGIVDLPCMNAKAFSLQEKKARKRACRFGEINWIYISLNDINASNADMTMLVLDTWLRGCTGMLPWFSFAMDENYEKAETISGFYPGNRFGVDGPNISLRVKSVRKGMELLKYLETFRKTFGYTSIQMKGYVTQFLKMKGQTLSRYFEDAGTVQFGGDNSAALEEMKQDIIKRLSVKGGAFRKA